eukprot:GHVQ01023729.1.p1 GENE.GHVQ01023729.1~~GHVQ01023729.1.p1  ORF type:complete len:296 (+),score=37.83 GHVQ01023729.1:72-959(+)
MDTAPLKTSPISSPAGSLAFSFGATHSSSTASNGKPSMYPACGDATVGTTRSKLNLLQERISGFEIQMANEAAQRKSQEENRIHNIRDSITKLEKSLNSEIKRRVDGNKQLTQMFTQEVTVVQGKLEKIFVEKLDQLQTAVDSLTDRTSVMEAELSQQKEKCLREIQDQNASIVKDIGAVQTAFESSQLARTERENQICKRLNDLQIHAETQLEGERNSREQKYSCFHSALQEANGSREREDEKFQTFILEEVAALKGGLVTESQGRERADDDIVQAINHYTKALQDALRLVNTA